MNSESPQLWRTAASLASCTVLLAGASSANADSDYCPNLKNVGVMQDLPFNAAFLSSDEQLPVCWDKDASDADREEGCGKLTLTSFFNINTTTPFPPFDPDLVARINNVDSRTFDVSTDLDVITDRAPGPPKTVWPNEAVRVRASSDLFGFDAVVIPQGFHPAPAPGRLTVVSLEDYTEYVIHQSTNEAPAFYHKVLTIDMDGDGLKDLVTVRSNFRVGQFFNPPFGQLVWFQNPGQPLDPNTPWAEHVLYGSPTTFDPLGPDISLDAHDFDGDGVPEIVATHFFSGDGDNNPPTKGKIVIYGTPWPGGSWTDVTPAPWTFPRVATISDDQGFPFGVKITDLNKDGKLDILATNHQPDGCAPFPTIPGRVYALEAPASPADVFKGVGHPDGNAWTTHILLDDIRPQPSIGDFNPPGRLAPGHAEAFYRSKTKEAEGQRPLIVVGGDEAGKVWVLKPIGETWSYKSAVIFDINDYYGEGTTQTENSFGISISTIGAVTVRYDQRGRAHVYVPVFEGRDVHEFAFGNNGPRIECLPDETLACPAP